MFLVFRKYIRNNQVNKLLMLNLICLICLACESGSDASNSSSITKDMSVPIIVAPEVDAMRIDDVTDFTIGGNEAFNDLGVLSSFGQSCQSNVDCETGFCIASSQGFICTQSCLTQEDCAMGTLNMRCDDSITLGADGQKLCVPSEASLCQPCFKDEHCFGGLCVNTGVGTVCAVDCQEGVCPESTTCAQQDAQGRMLAIAQCIPDTSLCGCSSDQAGETRTCVRTSDQEDERCFGEETCDPAVGWSGCDAPEPAEEICDGVDNNCNGQIDEGFAQMTCSNANEWGSCPGVELCEAASGVICVGEVPSQETCDTIDNDCDELIDEDFKNDGLYASIEHCGSCGRDCNQLLPLATEVSCVVVEEEATCQVITCRQGFVLVEDTCIPLASRLCSTCVQDSDCNQDVGDRCVIYSLNDDNDRATQGFCGRDCSMTSLFGETCPLGFECSSDGQCIKSEGSCLCDSNESFIIPCTLSSPLPDQANCIGQQVCDNGILNACEPPQEQCDGFDDDCDGLIDEDFYDFDQNAYNQNEHCGRCFYNCDTVINGENLNGDAMCHVNEGEARCQLDCDPQYVDVNGVNADGCECRILTANIDEPDDLGIDADCDGIDGQVSRGVFVSPTGDDTQDGSRTRPVRTIQRGIEMATAQRDHVYVAAGVYTEIITLRAGISIFGGYNSDYSRRDLQGNETAIFPSTELEGDRRGTLNASQIRERQTIVAGFTIVGYPERRPSRSSYTVYIQNSDATLIFRSNQIRGSQGGNGLNGGAGRSGINAPDTATEGDTEQLTESGNHICTNSIQNTSFGGFGAMHQCQSPTGNLIATSGGDGASSNCPTFEQPEANGSNGLPVNVGGVGGAGAYGQRSSYEFFEDTCYCTIPDVIGSTLIGQAGSAGSVGQDGSGGGGCQQDKGRVENGYWVANEQDNQGDGAGVGGTHGQVGGGGGGGGAGGGVVHEEANTCYIRIGNSSIGGAGGGGGAGGCGGEAGLGGHAGGGSFAVFIFNNSPLALEIPTFENNRIERGFGGNGGNGGAGGSGGSGSLGKIGRTLTAEERIGYVICANPGGRGGDGGAGGAGGAGGGGCGGPSVGIYIFGYQPTDQQALSTANLFPAIGAGGEGGQGGLSLGENGENGSQGLYLEVSQ